MIIFADDVGTGDVPGYFNNTSLVNMPNLEDLVQQGTTFTDAHSTPLCAPSRYVLLSGNYQHRGSRNGGTWTVNYLSSQFRPGQKSIAQVFKDNGYQTAIFGKWHLGGRIPTKSSFSTGRDEQIEDKSYLETLLTNEKHNWSKRLMQGPWDIGFCESYITTGGIQQPPYAFLRNSKFQEKDLQNLTYWEKGNYHTPVGKSKISKAGEGSFEWDSTAYNMILVDETEDFIKRQKKHRPEQPFFTYVALGSVHIPHSPPKKYLDGSDVAGQYATKHMDVLGEMDKVVGSLVKILEDNNVIDDTIILFASDNGGLGKKHGSHEHGQQSSGPLRSAKGSIYEGGHRIPMIIRWDRKIPKGETRTHMVGLNDLYATLCDLVDIPVPANQAVDSVSFANYAKNKVITDGLREYLGVWRFKANEMHEASIRKGQMKLIHRQRTNSVELYDLSKDLSETNNIAENNEYLVREMLEELSRIGPCYDMEGKFYVGAKGAEKSCTWFSEREKRCNLFYEGRINCGLSCATNENRSQCSVGEREMSVPL